MIRRTLKSRYTVRSTFIIRRNITTDTISNLEFLRAQITALRSKQITYLIKLILTQSRFISSEGVAVVIVGHTHIRYFY